MATMRVGSYKNGSPKEIDYGDISQPRYKGSQIASISIYRIMNGCVGDSAVGKIATSLIGKGYVKNRLANVETELENLKSAEDIHHAINLLTISQRHHSKRNEGHASSIGKIIYGLEKRLNPVSIKASELTQSSNYPRSYSPSQPDYSSRTTTQGSRYLPKSGAGVSVLSVGPVASLPQGTLIKESIFTGVDLSSSPSLPGYSNAIPSLLKPIRQERQLRRDASLWEILNSKLSRKGRRLTNMELLKVAACAGLTAGTSYTLGNEMAATTFDYPSTYSQLASLLTSPSDLPSESPIRLAETGYSAIPPLPEITPIKASEGFHISPTLQSSIDNLPEPYLHPSEESLPFGELSLALDITPDARANLQNTWSSSKRIFNPGNFSIVQNDISLPYVNPRSFSAPSEIKITKVVHVKWVPVSSPVMPSAILNTPNYLVNFQGEDNSINSFSTANDSLENMLNPSLNINYSRANPQ